MTGLISSESTREERLHVTYNMRHSNLVSSKHWLGAHFHTAEKKTKAHMKYVYGHRNHILSSEQMFLWCWSGKKKKKQFHMVTGGGHKCSCHAQQSSHWLPLFLCSSWFTDSVTQGRLECLPQWPNMALPYPPHTYLDQSKHCININKILQATNYCMVVMCKLTEHVSKMRAGISYKN